MNSSALRALLPCAFTLILACSPSHAEIQPFTLDFESSWADLAPNTFINLSTSTPNLGGLQWGSGWFGETTSPLQGSNNELRLGAGSFAVSHANQPFFLDSVDFRSLTEGGSIKFDFVVTKFDATKANGVGQSVIFKMNIGGATASPGNPILPLLFTTFTETASLGPLLKFEFANFKASGQTTDRNLFVMDNLKYRMDVASPAPEPDTSALLLAGLGVVGWVLRRNSKAR